MESDKSKQIIRRELKDHDDTGYVEGTPAERVAIQ